MTHHLATLLPCLLPCLLCVGCPAAPASPPPASARAWTSAPATAETRPPAAATPLRQSALHASETVTRSEVLEAQPREVLEEVFDLGKRDRVPSGWSVAVCTEQLRSADVPPQALDLVLVAIQRALNAQSSREGVRLLPELRTRLARDLRLQSQGLPGLAAWTEPLLRALDERCDLACARDFFERVHVLWRLSRTP